MQLWKLYLKLLRISSRHLQYRYLSCWWWIYVERIGQKISQKTDLPVYIAEDPLRAVVRGTGMAA
jgi:hypothetical protein